MCAKEFFYFLSLFHSIIRTISLKFFLNSIDFFKFVLLLYLLGITSGDILLQTNIFNVTLGMLE